MVIFKFDLSHKKTKQGIVLHLPHFQKPKTGIARGERGSSCWNENGVGFSERRSSFSLKIRVIRPSAIFGLRRKDVLRGAGYMWTPVL